VSDWKIYFIANKNCVATLGWTLNDNCNFQNAPWVDPRSRTCADTSEFINVREGILAAQGAN
jgi:hypothetical protein